MIALAMFTAVGAGAQTIYDATNIAQKELNGTARFVGMGGAMGDRKSTRLNSSHAT